MFNNLVNGFNRILDRLKKPGTVRQQDIEAVLEDLKVSLLEADVHYEVVNQFLSVVREKAIGAEVHKALSPSQQILKIIHDELTELLGSKSPGLSLKGSPAVIMLVGLQGSGKTTTAVKFAKYLKEKMNRKPLLVGVDFNRPAAVEQLRVFAETNGMDVYTAQNRKAVKAVKEAKEHAAKNGNDTVIIDTAGRLHIDKELMDELKDLRSEFTPSEILLVADAMLGQDAVTMAREFDGLLDLTGFILTKLDSDTRGGAALSLFHTTKKPIKFMGFGEKAAEFDVFHPDRVSSRILDLGDVMTLIEKAQASFDKEEAIRLEKKLKKNSFDIDDFHDQLKQIKKLGSISGLMSMIPGVSGMMSKLQGMAPPEEELKKIEAIINSMTKKERQAPDIINGSRRKRIALGSGTTINDVNKFLKSFDHMKKLMKHLPKSGFPDLRGMGNINIR